MIDLLAVGLLVWGVWSWQDRMPLRRKGKPPPAADKQEAMRQIVRAMHEWGITPEDLAKAQTEPEMNPPLPERKAGDVAMRVFSYLGGIFILGGIGAYISMFWPTMPSSMRIFITLGVGLGFAAFSMVAMKEAKYPRIILPLIVIAALMETGGWFVFVDEMFPRGGDMRKAACFVFGVMALQEWGTLVAFRRTALFFFAVSYSYSFLQNALDLAGLRESFIAMLLGGSLICVSDWAAKSQHRRISHAGFLVAALWFNAGLYDYTGNAIGWPEGAMAAGLSLCALGWGLKLSGEQRLPGFFFFIGSCAFYAGLFEWVWHTPYEVLYLGVAIAMMYAHTLVESRALLITSTFAILGFIGYFTEEHFVHSVGWPVALIVLGAVFFGVGAMAVRLGKRE